MAFGDWLPLLSLLLGSICDVTGVRMSCLRRLAPRRAGGLPCRPAFIRAGVHSLSVARFQSPGWAPAVASWGPRLSRSRRHQLGGSGAFLTILGAGWSGVKVPTAQSLVRALFLASGRPSPGRVGSPSPDKDLGPALGPSFPLIPSSPALSPVRSLWG